MFQKHVNKIGSTKVLAGINIQRYETRDIKGFISEDVELTENSYLRENSVLFQEIISHIQNPTDHIKLIGTIVKDVNSYIILDTIQQITLTEKFSNKFILALLNSKLINWYIYRFIFAKAIRTMHFSNQVIKRIPVPNINLEQQQIVIKMTDEVLHSKEQIKKIQRKY